MFLNVCLRWTLVKQAQGWKAKLDAWAGGQMDLIGALIGLAVAGRR